MNGRFVLVTLLSVCSILYAFTNRAKGETALAKLASDMKPGEWRELHSPGYDKELLTSGRAGIITYSDSAAWDAKTRTLHFIGQGHLSPPPKHISYRDVTNQWKAEPCPDWLARLKWFHSYDNNSCDPINGLFFHRPSASNSFWQYDIQTEKWSQLPDLPSGSPRGHGTATAFFPELGEKGSLLTFYTGQLHRYDMSTAKWHSIEGDFSKAQNYHNVAEYNLITKTVIFGGGNGSRQLYSIDRQGEVTSLKPSPCVVGVNSSHLAVCPASGELLVLSYAKDAKGFWALDSANEKAEWTALEEPPVGIGAMATISTYGVILHLNYQGIMVYKHKLGKN